VRSRSSRQARVARVAAFAALAAALALAGCGRKSALDPPPGAAITGQPGTAGSAGGAPDTVAPDTGIDQYGRPMAPASGGQRKSAPLLDWLVD
jgi:predicted small lipoprotein YifL